MPYTVEEAQRRIPEVLKTMALSTIEAIILLDTHNMKSRDFERVIYTIRGNHAYLENLCHVIWKAPKLAKGTTP